MTSLKGSPLGLSRIIAREHRYGLVLIPLLPGHFDRHVEPNVSLVDADQRGDERRSFVETHLDQQIRHLAVECPAVALVHPDPRPDFAPPGDRLPIDLGRQAVWARARRSKPDVSAVDAVIQTQLANLAA